MVVDVVYTSVETTGAKLALSAVVVILASGCDVFRSVPSPTIMYCEDEAAARFVTFVVT